MYGKKDPENFDIYDGIRSCSEMTGMDFGDVIALILGLIIGTIGILACLGAYARKLSGVERL